MAYTPKDLKKIGDELKAQYPQYGSYDSAQLGQNYVDKFSRPQQEQSTSGLSTDTSFLDQAYGAASGASAAIYEKTGKLMELADWMNPFSRAQKKVRKVGVGEGIPTIGEFIGKAGEDVGSFVRSDVKKQAKQAEAVGGFIGTLAAEIPLLVSGGEAISLAKSTPQLLKLFSYAPRLSKTGEFLAKSIGTTTVATATTNEELPTPAEAGMGIGIDLALGITGKMLRKAAPQLFRVGVNPEGANWKQINQRAQDASGQYMGTKRMIVNSADKLIEKESKKLRNLISNQKKLWKLDFFTDKAIELAKKRRTISPRSSNAITKYVEAWADANKGTKFDAKTILDMKQQFGETLSTVFKGGKAMDPSIAAEKQAMVQVWQRLDDALNSISKNVKTSNNAMTVAYSVKAPLEKALEKPFLQNFLSMLTPANIPTVTPVATAGAGLLSNVGKAAENTGVTAGLKSFLLGKDTP